MIELKDSYDEAILQGTIEGAELTKACDAKSRMDGSGEMMARSLACNMARSRAELLQGDTAVAYSIASILYTSTILYGKTGETFLQEKLQQCGESFSQEEYSNAVAEAVLGGYGGSRKQRILEGVQAALSDADHVEANAAKTTIMLHENWRDGIFQENDALEEAYLNGEALPMQALQEKMQRAKYGEVEEAEALEKLNILYAHLQANPSVMHARYRAIYPDVSEERRLAYYISKLGHTEVERIMELAMEENPLR